jgi:HlyD family secretion protein
VPARSAIALIAVATATLVAGCSGLPRSDQPQITASGTVRDEVISVHAPLLQRPALDYAVGLPGVRASKAPVTRAAASSQPTLSATVAAVETAEGSTVRAGQVVARFDDRDLVIGVEIARTAAAKSHADVRVLDSRLADLESAADTLATTRSQVLAAITKGRSGRAALLANIAALEKLISHTPPGPGRPPPMSPDPRVLLARLKAGLAKLDAGLAKARSGLARLDAGRARLSDARAAISSARVVLTEVAKAADAGVPVAEAKLAQAVVRAPADGLVVAAAEPGTPLMADAPVIKMRRVGPARVDAYLTPEDAARVRVGARADTSIDSLPGRAFTGRVSELRPVYEYPPTSTPTTEIHMIRAFRVTVTLSDPVSRLPPGTPADVTIVAE